jgi:MFS family permease
MLSTAFLFLNPQFDCPGNGVLSDNCYNNVCALSPDQWQNFIAADSDNFKSLANTFDDRFYCDDEIYLNLYSSLPYLGALVGYITISFYADNKGRRKPTIVGWSVSILGIVMTLASPNITLASIGLFFAGVGTESAAKITLMYMVEVFEANLRQKSMVVILACFSVGGMESTLFYYLFEDWWTATLCFIFIPAVLVLILMITFLQESPMFLVREGAATAQKAMNKIGMINTGRFNCLTIQDIENVIKNQRVEQFNRTTTPLDLFRFKSSEK